MSPVPFKILVFCNRATLRKLTRAAGSLTGLLAISTALVAAASWFSVDLTIVCLATYLLLLASLTVLAFRPRPPFTWPPQWSLRRTFVVTACFAVLAATISAQAPFRLRFALSRSSLDRLADRLEGGQSIRLPQRTGLFMVYKAELMYDGRFICLWTDLDSSGYSGFVRRQVARGPLYNRNLWWNMTLDDRWQFVEED